MKIRSSTNFIALGLAFLTLNLVLVAHSLGIAPDDAKALLRARVQMAELVAAQCSPAAADGDLKTMVAIVRQIALRNHDLTSAGLRDADGKLIYAYGPHEATWASRGEENGRSPAMVSLSVPIATDKGDWGEVEFCFPRDTGGLPLFVPQFLRALLSNPAIRIGAFVATAGFICFSVYLRRTLRHLDPSAVIPPRVRAMLDALAEGVVVLDAKGQIVMANESFSRSTGLSPDAIQGHNAERLGWTQPHSDQPPSTLPWRDVLASGRPVKGSSLGIRLHEEGQSSTATSGSSPEPAQRILSVNAAPVLGPDGRVRGALATFDDVTELERINLALKESRDEVERQNDQLRILATTDPMTGCLNRRSFLTEFEVCWSKAATGESVLGCVMVDVDKFKSINDRFGHSAGDSVLKGVARILLSAAAGAEARVCRYGGEEFCVLLPGKDLQATAEFAEQLRSLIEQEPWTITPVTASLGVASSEQHATEVKELLDQADRALYASKRCGRNRVTRWGYLPPETPAAENPPQILSPAADWIVAPRIIRDQGTQQGFVTLTSALAHRDINTALHSRRVTDYCMLAAPGLLTPDQAAHLEVAALLHDVGKLAVPDSILLKPGPLTPEEWEVMRLHALVGVDLAAAAGMPQEVLYIIAAHHAKLNKDPGDQPNAPDPRHVPIAARLLSVADAYDAMTSDRPYRKAMAFEPALRELQKCAGTQFDPLVVAHFVAAIERAADARLLPRRAA